MTIKPECLSRSYEALTVGCNNPYEMEFKSPCTEQSTSGTKNLKTICDSCRTRGCARFVSSNPPLSSTAYTCFASWQDNNTRYTIAAPVSRTAADLRLYCLVYSLSGTQPSLLDGALGRSTGPPVLRLSAVSESCHRHIVPGATGLWFFNFTSNGKWTGLGFGLK